MCKLHFLFSLSACIEQVIFPIWAYTQRIEFLMFKAKCRLFNQFSRIRYTFDEPHKKLLCKNAARKYSDNTAISYMNWSTLSNEDIGSISIEYLIYSMINCNCLSVQTTTARLKQSRLTFHLHCQMHEDLRLFTSN